MSIDIAYLKRMRDSMSANDEFRCGFIAFSEIIAEIEAAQGLRDETTHLNKVRMEWQDKATRATTELLAAEKRAEEAERKLTKLIDGINHDFRLAEELLGVKHLPSISAITEQVFVAKQRLAQSEAVNVELNEKIESLYDLLAQNDISV